jgi:uncharacterized protein YhfF
MYEHLKSCEYCQKTDRASKLAELGYMIKGTKAASTSSVTTTKSYLSSNINGQLKKAKLRELGKTIKGFVG